MKGMRIMNDFTDINKRMDKELKSSKYWWYSSIVIALIGLVEVLYGIWVDSSASVLSAMCMMLFSYFMLLQARMCDLKLEYN
jgi:hypothetical protein